MAKQSRLQGLIDGFDRLSSREKWMVVGLGLAFGLVFGGGLLWVATKQINSLEERNESVRTGLAAIEAQQDAYLAKKAKFDAQKKLLDDNNVKLVRVMESQATTMGFEIENFREKKRPLTENFRKLKKKEGAPKKVVDLVEESQTVEIKKVSLETVAKFLSNLESRREPIKVTRLDITTSNNDRQVLRKVNLTVSTYRNEVVEQ